MMFNTKLFLVILFAASFIFAADLSAKGKRTKYNFNSDWKLFVGDATGAENFNFDDARWKNVTTPHSWNEDDAFRKDIKDLSTGIVWYRKHFRLPEEKSKDKKIFLEFEGIRMAGEFYLNGKFVGRHENGVMAFGFDISEFVSEGENMLAVRLDNAWDYKEKATNSAFQWNDKNFYANYGGINKNVYLHITGKLYQTLPLYTNLKTTGVYIYAQDFDIKNKEAKITAETQIKNEFSIPKTFEYEVVIEDLNGKTVKKINGGNYTLAPNETKTVAATSKMILTSVLDKPPITAIYL